MSRILCIDDDPSVLRILRGVLEAAGHQVTTLDDPLRLDTEKHRPHEAIILDVMMPNRSGWDCLRILKEDPHSRNIPVLMLSSVADVANRVRGIRLGANDFAAKPFDAADVLARIEGLIQLQAAYGVSGPPTSTPTTVSAESATSGGSMILAEEHLAEYLGELAREARMRQLPGAATEIEILIVVAAGRWGDAAELLHAVGALGGELRSDEHSATAILPFRDAGGATVDFHLEACDRHAGDLTALAGATGLIVLGSEHEAELFADLLAEVTRRTPQRAFRLAIGDHVHPALESSDGRWKTAARMPANLVELLEFLLSPLSHVGAS